MNKTSWAVIFGILLFLVLVFMILWTLQTIKTSMDKKRKRRTAEAKKHNAETYRNISSTFMGYWYNTEDMEGADDIAKLRSKHYFSELDECITDLITEMYDCGLVRTEELYTIAYGSDALTPDSPVFQITDADSGKEEDPTGDEAAEDTAHVTDDEDTTGNTDTEDTNVKAELPPVSDDAQRKIYSKWSGYVDDLLELVEIKTTDEHKKAIVDGLLTYGRKNLMTLLYSPK